MAVSEPPGFRDSRRNQTPHSAERGATVLNETCVLALATAFRGGCAPGKIELPAELLNTISVYGADFSEGAQIRRSCAAADEDSRAGGKQPRQLDELARKIWIILRINDTQRNRDRFIAKRSSRDFVRGQTWS